MLKKTKILCTIGPATLDENTLKAMYKAGMNGARINTAYGDTIQYRDVIAKVRKICEISTLLDIKGPELRVRTVKALSLKDGDILTLGDGEEVSLNHPVYDQLRIGDKVLFDDAKIGSEVSMPGEGRVSLRIKVGGLLENGKGVNCPGRRLDVPTLSPRDLELIEFAMEQDVEYIGLSFARNVNDIRNLREEIEGSRIGIIAKIENEQGVKDFNRILSEADGIMVARGDLGIEVKQERVPLLQKHMIAACNQVGKTVITATEMLESMTMNPRPTRAEVSDVANAILDGTDVVMLSGETAVGKYPVEAVAMMARIGQEVERVAVPRVVKEKYSNISNVISWSVNEIVHSMPLDKVVTITRTGYTARAIARFRLKQPIIAITRDPSVKRRLELVYGVFPVYHVYSDDEDRILSAAEALLSRRMVGEEDVVLFTAAFRTSQQHASNLIEIHMMKELMEFRKSNRNP